MSDLNNQSHVLPQHRESSVARYMPFILNYLSQPIGNVVHIKPVDVAVTTFVARLRDSLFALRKYNYAGFDAEQMARVSSLTVAHTAQGVILGTQPDIKRTMAMVIPGEVMNEKNEIEVELAYLSSVLQLLNDSALTPQPVFVVCGILSTDAIKEQFPNVTFIPDPITPNKYRFI